MLKNILLSTIALLFISLVNCVAQTTSKTHTIYPRTGLAISCQIVSTSKDSIHFIPDYDTTSIYGLSMKQILGYSFNKSHEERIDSTQVNKIEAPKSNIQFAGSSIKTAVTLGLIGSTLKAISPFLISTTEEKKSILVSGVRTEYSIQKTDYTFFAITMGAGIACDIIGLISWYNAWNSLEKSEPQKLSFNVAPNGFRVVKRF